MRFYKIIIRRRKTKGGDLEVFIPPSMKNLGEKDVSYTSVINGKAITSALDVGIDVPLTLLANPRQGARIRISGISLEDISQFTYLVEAEIEVHGGMMDGGLPLSRATKPDLLMHGLIWMASGNWEGVNMTLDLILTPLAGLDPKLKEAEAKNMIFNCPVGRKISEAITEMLTTVYGKSASNPNGYEIKVEISDELVAKDVWTAYYYNLSDFAKQIKIGTRAHFPNIKTEGGGKYDGVEVKVFDKLITVFDGTKTKAGSKNTKENPLIIKFHELIGQPGWKSQNLLVFKTVMRGDLEIRDWVKLPSALRSPFVLTTADKGQAVQTEVGIGQPSKVATTFQGAFEIREIRHVGQFRQASAISWVTVFDALVHPPAPKETTAPPPEQPLTKKDPAAKTGPRVPTPAPSTTQLPAFELFPPPQLGVPTPAPLPPFSGPGLPQRRI